MSNQVKGFVDQHGKIVSTGEITGIWYGHMIFVCYANSSVSYSSCFLKLLNLGTILHSIIRLVKVKPDTDYVPNYRKTLADLPGLNVLRHPSIVAVNIGRADSLGRFWRFGASCTFQVPDSV